MLHEGGPASVTYVVKSNGRKHPEKFNREKLHKSIVGACISSGVPTGYAENIARRVTEEVVTWLENRPEVTSNDLRRVAAKHLNTYHPDASYLFENHRSTL